MHPTIVGASQTGLTLALLDRCGGVYTAFFLTRDLGTMISWAKSGPAASAWRLKVSVVRHCGLAWDDGDGDGDGDPDGLAWDVGDCDGDPLEDGLPDGLPDGEDDGLDDGEADPGTTSSVTGVPGNTTALGFGFVCH